MMVEFSKTKRSKEDVGVQVLLQKLRMNDDEKKGVFLAKEGAKLITVKGFSVTSLKNKMLSAWFLTREVFFCPIGDNMFMVQAFCLGVWKGIRREVTKAGYEALPTNNGAGSYEERRKSQ